MTAPPAPTEREIKSAVNAVTDALMQYSIPTCIIALERALVFMRTPPPPPPARRIEGRQDGPDPWTGPRRRKEDS